MVNAQSVTRMPVWFVSHGGGPLPLLGDKQHRPLVDAWKKMSTALSTPPKAIVVVSGHWEEEIPTVTSASNPGLLYDYYGFPAEAYDIQYPAPGDPELAQKLLQLLKKGGWTVKEESKRGYDHGVFVPLKHMFPKADIPVVALSLLNSLDAKKHVEMGEAISAIRDEGILVIGSGLSYHNMQSFRSGNKEKESQIFDDWLQDVCTSDKYSAEERKTLLVNWEKAPQGRASHPREEHLLPLHVAMGCALGQKAKLNFSGSLFSCKVSGFSWD